MAVITLASFGHSPGTTTAATALALRWPTPVMLLEADSSKPSAALSGYLRGQSPHVAGLDGLAVASQRGELTPAALWQQSMAITETVNLVPGFTRLAAATGSGAFWTELAALLRTTEGSGTDVIVDCGRITPRDPRYALIETADSAALTIGATLPDIAACTARFDDQHTLTSNFLGRLEDQGRREHARLIVIDRAFENYSEREISSLIGAPALGTLPWDPDSASHWTLGRSSNKKLDRRPYQKAIDALTGQLRQHIADRRAVLSAKHQPRPEGAHRES